ncbi:hypothetical protein [Leucobacter chironomi]|uniref:hypothetical protein n=1 Tax=Leucobacter chironomi TaxID=491918 RepID=UPI000421BA50|nr:hypothetical protein [Leucobacter chironomi]
MTQIAVNPFQLTDCLFTVESDNYEAHVSKVEFVPTSTSAQFKGMTPSAAYTFAGTPTWVCNLTFAQDWNTPDSLSRYLFEHTGESIDVTFEPQKGGPAITATLTAQPGSIGGDVDAVATSSVALGVVGKPVLEPLAP